MTEVKTIKTNKLKSLFIKESNESNSDDDEITIEYENCDPKTKELIETQFSNLFSEDQLAELEEAGLFLYYRGITSIKRISDPDIDFDDDEELQEKDPLNSLVGLFYLLGDKEKNRLSYEKRRSPIEPDVSLRLAYINFQFLGILNGNIGFFVDQSLLDTKKRIKDKSIQQARMKALAFITHLALDQDQALRDKIADLQIDVQKKDMELDAKRDKELQGMLRNGSVDKVLNRNLSFQKINLTTIVLTIIGVLIGVIGTLMFKK
ncbi:MAG: hypothetical protein ACTSWL_08235 [Promethearchaeota archaeon]